MNAARVVLALSLLVPAAAPRPVVAAEQPPDPAPVELFERVEAQEREAPRARARRAGVSSEVEAAVAPGVWEFQGPAGVRDGQVEGIPNAPVTGAIHTVVAHPTNPNLLWIGSVNGGVWRTHNAQAPRPNWTPLTDAMGSLSIGALELDPTDPSARTLVAGIGRYSSFSRNGGPRLGLLRTTDGGTTWTVRDGGGTLAGRNISGVAPRGNVIVASASLGGCTLPGIYRSTDAGATFTKISGAPGSGMPGGEVHDLEGDPMDPSILYAAVRGAAACTPGSVSGLYKSMDTGATWVKVSDAAIDALAANDDAFNNAEITVGNAGEVYVGLIHNGRLAGLFRSGDGGATWTELDKPATNEGPSSIGLQPNEHPGAQGQIHFAIRADPTDPDIVYLGGDRQPGTAEGVPFPNSLGAMNYSGRLFRVDASRPRGEQSSALTHCAVISPACPTISTLSNSAPHADAREIVIDAAGDMIEVDDGGIYRRTNPRGTGDWISVVGYLGVAEVHDIAYDSVSNMVMVGTQDNGTSEQRAVGALDWTAVSTADGGDVQVDDRSSTTQSTRYSSFQNFGSFRRRIVNAAGVTVSTVFPSLTVSSGPAFSGQFVTPLELNAVDPTRILIGGNNDLYESLDRGDTIRALGFGNPIGSARTLAMVYGGYSGGVANLDLIYVVHGPHVYVRTSGGGAPVRTSGVVGAGTSTLRDVAVDVAEWRSVWVVNALGQVYASGDAGATWSAVTGNLASLATDLRAIVVLPDAVVVGGQSGVYRMELGTPGVWSRFGTGLTDAIVWDLEYDRNDNVLLAGTLGRGAWKLRQPAASGGPALSIDDAAVREGSGPGTLAFVVTLSPSAPETVTVDYATQDGTATAGTDYQAVSGTLTFAPGTIEQVVSVPVIGDLVTEPDETLFVNLTNPVQASLTRAQGRGRLVNDDVSAISGRVTDSDGRVISGVQVAVYTSSGSFIASNFTDVNGVYSVALSAAGTYFARTFNGLGYVNVLYDRIVCVTCVVTTGAPIVVRAGETTSGIDFALPLGGRVFGTVRDAVTGNPIVAASVQIIDGAGRGLASATTNSSGRYTTTTGLPAGTYHAWTIAPAGYVDELYDDILCPYDCVPSTGRPITITPGTLTTDIDFRLAPGGRISGVIRAEGSNAPLVSASVDVYMANGTYIASALTDAQGRYATVYLPAASYFVVTRQSQGYVNEVYDDRTCVACDVTTGTPVAVAAGTTTNGIDFTLVRGGPLSGRVTDTAGTGLSGVSLYVYSAAGNLVTTVATSSSGTYTTQPLVPGSYFVQTWNRAGFIDEAYDDVLCLNCDPSRGTPVAVAAVVGAPGINFALAPGGRIAGRVTDLATGAPRDRAWVEIYDPRGVLTYGFTDANGEYVSHGGLPSGTYFARTFRAFGYSQVYDALFCTTCPLTFGSPIAVTAPQTVSGIDFRLFAGPIATIGGGERTIAEGDEGTREIAVPVTLSVASSQEVRIDYATADGTATAGSDYASSTGTLVFPPGSTEQVARVSVLGDRLDEPDETFGVVFGPATGAAVPVPRATITILDDDLPEPARLHTPVPGSTLTETTVEFAWDPVPGGQQYCLDITLPRQAPRRVGCRSEAPFKLLARITRSARPFTARLETTFAAGVAHSETTYIAPGGYIDPSR